MLSSLATSCARMKPHRVHLCMIRETPPEETRALCGSIEPPQREARSPGFSSTCLLQRHAGQWLVYPLPVTRAPHSSQTKSSMLRIKRFIDYFASTNTLPFLSKKPSAVSCKNISLMGNANSCALKSEKATTSFSVARRSIAPRSSLFDPLNFDCLKYALARTFGLPTVFLSIAP